MLDTQKCPDICGQMHGAVAAAGRIPPMCWHGEITYSDHPFAALKDLLLIRCTLFLEGHKSLSMTQGPISQQQSAPAVHILHK